MLRLDVDILRLHLFTQGNVKTALILILQSKILSLDTSLVRLFYRCEMQSLIILSTKHDQVAKDNYLMNFLHNRPQIRVT